MERSSWSRTSSWMSARTEAAQSSSSAATPHPRVMADCVSTSGGSRAVCELRKSSQAENLEKHAAVKRETRTKTRQGRDRTRYSLLGSLAAAGTTALMSSVVSCPADHFVRGPASIRPSSSLSSCSRSAAAPSSVSRNHHNGSAAALPGRRGKRVIAAAGASSSSSDGDRLESLQQRTNQIKAMKAAANYLELLKDEDVDLDVSLLAPLGLLPPREAPGTQPVTMPQVQPLIGRTSCPLRARLCVSRHSCTPNEPPPRVAAPSMSRAEAGAVALSSIWVCAGRGGARRALPWDEGQV